MLLQHNPTYWNEPRHKRALVLSGGGAKGCWQAGAILKLHELGYRYDAYFGVSVGAINAAHMAQYGDFQELPGAIMLKTLWHAFENADVWRHHNRLLRWLAVPWQSSALNTEPLRQFLQRRLDLHRVQRSGKTVAVGACSMTSGEYQLVFGDNPAFGDAVYASAAFPIAFEMGRFNNEYWYDGGLVHVTPLGAAIDWGATHVHAITLNAEGIPTWTPARRSWYYPRLVDVAVRTLDVIMENIVEGDLARCRRINRLIHAGRAHPDRRLIAMDAIRPVDAIPVDSLDFNPETMAKGFALGYDRVEGWV